MTTPDTTEQDEAIAQEHAEVADKLYETIMGASEPSAIDSGELAEAIEPVLAKIRRQAAAAALREQASVIRASVPRMRDLGRQHPEWSSAYYAKAEQADLIAGRLHRAAADAIAEGWEHTCAASFAATRSDPGYGCDTPVPDAGDYCPRHEPEDDDRWAE